MIPSNEAAAYFSQGFVPSAQKARISLEQLLETIKSQKENVSSRPLIDLIKEDLAKYTPRGWTIALTGGLDSRFLLAALDKNSTGLPINCFTWGTPTSPDVKGAARAARAHKHFIIDTRFVEWDPDEIVMYLRSLRPVIGTSMPRLDAVWLFNRISQSSPRATLRLNGYLGDMLSGAHLRHAISVGSAPEAITSINKTQMETSFDPVKFYSRFCEENYAIMKAIKDISEFSDFDLLDYAFRQEQRIHPIMEVDGASWISPFNTPKIIAHWAMTPPSERINQSKYRNQLAKLIGKENLPGREALISKAISRLKIFGSQSPPGMKNRADPTQNTSLRDLMQETCEALDRRRILDINFSSLFFTLLEKPNQRDWTVCLLAMSMELHLRSM